VKILIVNTSDIQGGAARAAYRLHHGLNKHGITSEILCNDKTSDDYTVELVAYSLLRKLRAKASSFFDRIALRKYKSKSKTLFSQSKYSSGDALNAINNSDADIIHLHWINHGMLSVEDIANINKPIVYSLHDMWIFTGGCHYDEECGNYIKACGECKVLKSTDEKDLSRRVYNRKYSSFSKKNNITFIALSDWLKKSAQSSSLLSDKKVVNIPNPISVNKFKTIDKNNCLDLWNLPHNKKLILFGAMGATSDPRKGFKELSQAINLSDLKDVELVVFGSSKPKESTDYQYKIHYLGTLSDDVSLVTLYNAVDVMIVPSLQENLSNAIMESLACGTPVVGFDIGGNSDLIDHKQNGYLAKPFDTSDLSQGIRWVIEHKDHKQLKLNARNKVLKEFDEDVVIPKYIKLYNNILTK